MEGICRFIGSDGLSSSFKESLLLVLRERGALESRDPLDIVGMDVMGGCGKKYLFFVPKLKEAATNLPLIVYINLTPRTNRLPQEAI